MTIHPTVLTAPEQLPASALEQGILVTIEPGNASRAEMFMIKHPRGGLLVGMTGGGVGRGLYHFDHYAHPHYLGEKLGLTSADADALAPYINCQLAQDDH